MANKVKVPLTMNFSFRDPNNGRWYFSYFWKQGWFHCRAYLHIGKTDHQDTTWKVRGKLEGSGLEKISRTFTPWYRKLWRKALIAKLTEAKSSRHRAAMNSLKRRVRKSIREYGRRK